MFRQGLYINLEKENEGGKTISSKRFIPEKYYTGINSKDTKKQIKSIKKSIESYPKGIYIDRPKLKTYKSKKSNYILKFNKAYGVSITDKKAVAKKTGVSVKAQERILKKGKGAYYSSGSRPGQSASSWAYARLASVIMGGKAKKYDQHILDDENIKIKKPHLSKTKVTKKSLIGKKIKKNKKTNKDKK